MLIGTATYLSRQRELGKLLAKIDMLLMDDWRLCSIQSSERHDLLEVVDDRVNTRSTIIGRLLQMEHWNTWLNDPTLAVLFSTGWRMHDTSLH